MRLFSNLLTVLLAFLKAFKARSSVYLLYVRTGMCMFYVKKPTPGRVNQLLKKIIFMSDSRAYFQELPKNRRKYCIHWSKNKFMVSRA